jgi:proton translocating ATP synthase F1 alpha subunit
VEINSPSIIQRSPVTVPMMTGIAAIDCFFPLGRGQRELVIGDHNTGKTSLVLTVIINQRYINNVVCEWSEHNTWCDHKESSFIPCIYVSIGSKRSEIVRIRKVLFDKQAIKYTCIVFSGADDLAAVQYLAPFAGCAVGEWFMDHGYDVLVVYDDLTQHAIAYRQMALLLRRPPGREAYPGDIFYIHARLLERSAQLLRGGSLTALPIVQTFGGDISGYIPTNVISITDGQLFLVKSLINKGVRPAIDLGLSVSRVGSAAQYSAMTFVSKRIKSLYSLYRAYSGIVSVGGGDREANVYIRRGERLISFLKQELFETYSFYKQVVCLYALTLDAMDSILPEHTKLFFELLSTRHILNILDSRFATYYLDTETIEPLLMVFSFELIQDDIDELVTTLCKVLAPVFMETTDVDIIVELLAQSQSPEVCAQSLTFEAPRIESADGIDAILERHLADLKAITDVEECAAEDNWHILDDADDADVGALPDDFEN